MKIITTEYIKKGQILSESHLKAVKNSYIDNNGQSKYTSDIYFSKKKKDVILIEPFIGKRAIKTIQEYHIITLNLIEDANIQIRKEKKIKNYKEIVIPQIKNNLWL